MDVTGIQKKLKNGGDKLWDTNEAKTKNVDLHRPSHDAWGIKKVSSAIRPPVGCCFQLPPTLRQVLHHGGPCIDKRLSLLPPDCLCVL